MRGIPAKFRQQEPISVGALNKISEIASMAQDISGSQVGVGSDGVRIRDYLPEWFLAKVTSNDGASVNARKYAWTAKRITSAGVIEDVEPAFSGTTTINYAVSLSGAAIETNAMVLMRRGLGEWYEAVLFGSSSCDSICACLTASSTFAVDYVTNVCPIFDSGGTVVGIKVEKATLNLSSCVGTLERVKWCEQDSENCCPTFAQGKCVECGPCDYDGFGETTVPGSWVTENMTAWAAGGGGLPQFWRFNGIHTIPTSFWVADAPFGYSCSYFKLVFQGAGGPTFNHYSILLSNDDATSKMKLVFYYSDLGDTGNEATVTYSIPYASFNCCAANTFVFESIVSTIGGTGYPADIDVTPGTPCDLVCT